MRIPSGTTTNVINFVAVDSTDLTTRETGLSSFTVWRSRNGGTPAAMDTPTVTELSAGNMPGVYSLLVDEDTTIGATHDEEEMVFHITQASMADVSITVDLFRPKLTVGRTLSIEADGDLTKVNTLDGHTAQTGDSYARIGAGGVSLGDLGGMSNAMKAEVVTASESALTSYGASTVVATDIVSSGAITTGFGIAAANILAISDDATAADNLEAMYDGTGYTDDTGPASRLQVSQLSTGSASISTTADSADITTGTPTGTVANTVSLDGTYYQITPAGGNTDFYYEFNVGGDGVPTEFLWDGYANGNNDTYTVSAYNWVTTSWDQIGTIDGASGSTDVSKLFQATTGHVGSAANSGLVRLRFESANGDNLFTDRVLCSYAVVARSVGYAGGAIWVDTDADTANENTENYIDGVADNPVTTWAAALTLSGQLGLKRFKLSASSSITLTADSSGFEIGGRGASVALGSQDISDAVFDSVHIAGTGSATGFPIFSDCSLGTCTLPPSYMTHCGFEDTTVASAGDYFLVDCYSKIPGSTAPVLDMGAGIGATNMSIRRFGGGLTINNIETGDVVSAEATVGGTLTLDGDAGSSVEARGGWKAVVSTTYAGTLTDVSVNTRFDDTQGATFATGTDSLEAIRNRGDAAWITGGDATAANQTTIISDIAALENPSLVAIVDGVWDELLSGHTDSGSAGEQLAAAGAAGDPWATSLPGAYGAGTAGKLVGDNINSPLDAIKTNVDLTLTLTGTIDSEVGIMQGDVTLILADTADMQPKLGSPAGASISADIAVIDTEVGDIQGDVTAILLDTGTTLPASIATIDTNVDAILLDTGSTGVVISGTTANEIADAILKRDWTGVSGEASRSMLNALRFLRNKWSVAGTTLTVTEEDDATSAWTATVGTDAGAEPIISSDPT